MAHVKAINVTSTSANMDKLSRSEFVGFINDTLELDYTKVEQMCSGAAYCQMIHMLWPEKLPMKKVKFESQKLEHVYIANWKVLQEAFKRLHIEKDVPIQRLVKGRFQDNFEFLQWFYKFFTINDSGDHDNYDAQAVRGGDVGSAPTPIAKPAARKPVAKKAAPSAAAVGGGGGVKKGASNADVRRLEGEMNELSLTVEGLEKERDFYFQKLRDIEVICQEHESEEVFRDFTEKIVAILYATEDGFGQPAEEEEGEEVEQEEY